MHLVLVSGETLNCDANECISLSHINFVWKIFFKYLEYSDESPGVVTSPVGLAKAVAKV